MMSDELLELCKVHEAGLATLTRLSGELRQSGVVSATFSGLPVPPFNGINVWQDDDGLDDDILALVTHGAQQALPMSITVQVGASHEPRVEQIATELGFSPAGDPQPGMVLVVGEIPPLPAGIRCSSPDSAAELAAYADLMAEVFGFPLHVAQAAAHPDTLDWDDVEWFILWDDETPVATSMLIHIGDVASVVNVGVPAAHRRKGLGAAATWEVIRRGRARGATHAQLVASPMGEPVYARMGFEVVGHLRSFVRF